MIKKIFAKYNNIATPAKAAIWFMLCSIIPQAITVLSTTIFTRILTTNDYGISSNYSAWYNVISIFISLSLYCGVYNNAMAKYKEQRDEFTSAMMGLSLLLGLTGLFILFFSREVLSRYMDMPAFLIVYMGFHCLLYNPYGCWVSRTRYEYNYISLIKVTLLVSILSPVSSLVCILIFEDKAVGKIFGQYLIYLILGIILYIRSIIKCSDLYNKEFWKFAIKFNLPLIPHYLSLVLLNQSDRIMITKYCGASANGIYSVAYSAASLILLLNTGVTQAMTPWVYSEIEKNNKKSIRSICSTICLIYIIFDFVFILLIPEAVAILAGEKYKEAIYVVPPIASSMFWILLYNLYSIVEFYFEKTKPVMVCSTISALLNVGLNYLFIPRYGYIAAAYTTLVSYLINALMHALILGDICRKNNVVGIINVVRTFLLGIVLIISMIVALTLYKFTIVRWMIVIIATIIGIIYRKKIFSIYKQIRGK